jgi:GPH family glycoside/pentoside/hexuronide:cation symporter
MRQESESPGLSDAPLSLRHILLYNLAGFSLNAYDTILYAWLVYFYAPPQDSGRMSYVALGAVGAILAGGRILDAVSDPLIGYLSDHTKSRWGRRKPYIFVSAPLLFLAFLAVWLPPVGSTSLVNCVYLAAVLFVYYWAYTGVLVPWFALLPEMSPANDQRVKIASIGVAVGVMGALLGGGLSGPLFEHAGPFTMALALGGIAFVTGEMTLFGIKENRTVEESVSAGGFLRTLREVFADRQVLSFSVMILFVQMTYQLLLMNVPYMTTLILGRKETDASILVGEVILLMAMSAPLSFRLLSQYRKRSVFRCFIVAMAAGFGMSFFIGFTDRIPVFLQAMVIFPVAAIPMGGMFAASIAVIADLTDYDELKYGKRREAIYYGIYGAVRKSGWALSSLILAGVYSVFGYSAENALGVRVIWVVCAASCLIGWVAFIPYKLGDSKGETREIMNL